ncbi:LacI family DNA-binding transcriptional regulator [Brachybacterium sp. p3-SID957]|uniref:LacI family DNA-binding transcriptional regulator n=1 Tax=Brachybacterium sp. p3-SID957 TaxID=2916049 RepID=UPI00223C2058|nr:LacI family DNA-binding transcriptional regulator [Brachybacterium sp. p3-SID957]MCT1776332.1 LacI family transcriptional regulator [Brachybacterium sp. p3-SID957]
MSVRRRPTLRLVADRAGVSPSTVSRAFTRPELLAPETVERVRAAASELGYVADVYARGLRSGRRGAIGLVVPDIANAFFPPLIRAAQAAAAAHGLTTVIADSDEDPANEPGLVEQLGAQTDGVILVSSRMSADQIVEVGRRRPLVLVNRDISELPHVLIDSAPGMRQALEHLAGLGHRSVAYASGPATSWSNGQRERALRAGAAELGLRLTVLPHRRPSQEAGHAAAAEVLAAGATAVVAFDDALAQGLLVGFADAGVAVPETVSVIGCDDTIADVTAPALTTVHGPTRRAGELAVQLLMDVVGAPAAGDGHRPAVAVVPAHLVVRRSTAELAAGPGA